MIQAAASTLMLLVAGDALVERHDLPVPGAAFGLATLAVVFALRGGSDRGFDDLFDFAAPYFPLFFVPAAVGVVASLDVLSAAWLHVAVAIVLGTAATIAVAGRLTQALLGRIAEEAKT